MLKFTMTMMAGLLAAASLTGNAANLEEGNRIAKAVCVSCHGIDGNSQNQDYPKIGGQHPDYLAKALRDYQTGARNNAIMKSFAATLKSEDIENVSAWYARQPAALTTYR
jgi:cytochrome c553